MNFPELTVYAILKDEKENIIPFIEQFKDVDYIQFLDTGSTDGSYQLIEDIQKTDSRIHLVKAIIDPFSFSQARNLALHHAKQIADSSGLFLWLDLDERFEPDWYQKLTSYFIDYDINLETPQYFNTTMLFDKNKEAVMMKYSQRKIHTAEGFSWKFACHEILVNEGTVLGHNTEIEVSHLSQPQKERNYLPLLERDYADNPYNLRCLYYLAREFSYNKNYSATLTLLSKIDTMTDYASVAQKVEAYLLQASTSKLIKRYDLEDSALYKCLSVEPKQHEVCMRLSYKCHAASNPVGTLHWATEGLLYENKNIIYNKSDQIRWQLFDLAGVSYDRLGHPKSAMHCYSSIIDHFDRFLDTATRTRIEENIKYLLTVLD